MIRFLRSIFCPWPVDVFYHCYPKHPEYPYLMVCLTRLRKSSTLLIKNGFTFSLKGSRSGIISSNGHTYGYITFNYGYLIFSSDESTHFGYAFWKHPRKRSSKAVSPFCNYLLLTPKNLIPLIQELKNGPSIIN